MAWVKIDDHFDEHPKLAAIGPLGMALWVTGLAYCNRNLTDGFIPWTVARNLVSWEFTGPAEDDGRQKVWSVSMTCGMVGEDVTCKAIIPLLLDVGLWEEVPGGYQIHDYDQYQPSKAQIEAERKANAERQARYRDRHSGRYESTSNDGSNDDRNGVTTSVSNNRPDPVPVPDPQKEEPNGSSTPHTPQKGGTRKRKPKAAKTKERTLTPEQLERFERWYQHWPRKENRIKAEESWAAIDPDDALVEKMIATTKLYAASPKWQENGGEFIPHPSTWLNNARWNDQPPKVTSPTNVTKFTGQPDRSWRDKYLQPDENVIDVEVRR